MSTFLKRAALVIAILAIWVAVQVLRVVTSIEPAGSGGIGAVSFGLAEALLELVPIAIVVILFFYWRARRQRRTGVVG